MAVPHYAYLKLKMPGNNGTPITVHGSFARSDTCDREFQKIASKFGAKEELNAIDAAVDHTQPPADNRNEGALIEFLRERWEIFAWEPSDMPGIPRELAEHALNVDPTAKPVQQSMRRFSEPKRRAIGEEINRLRKAGFIRELKESEWVANPVMVPKKDTTALRMCIDYTGLNKHCPKDHFPLPRIDQIVDSTAGCDRLSFLDAYSGYNQIKLKKEDQELTAFITPHGVFCYNVMTFGLKNAGATYQRCMQACLGEQIGRNIEVYIDDIVVKTKHTATLVNDLRETFDNLDSRQRICIKCFSEQAPGLRRINLPEFNPAPPTSRLNWGHNAKSADPDAEVNLLWDFLGECVAGGRLSAEDLLCTYVERRVLPLQGRIHKIGHMSGRLDPTRTSKVALSKAQVARRVNSITKANLPDDWNWGLPPYDRSSPPELLFSRQGVEDGDLAQKIWTPDHVDPADQAGDQAGDDDLPEVPDQGGQGEHNPPPSPEQREEEEEPATSTTIPAVPLRTRPPAASATSAPQKKKRAAGGSTAKLESRAKKQRQLGPKKGRHKVYPGRRLWAGCSCCTAVPAAEGANAAAFDACARAAGCHCAACDYAAFRGGVFFGCLLQRRAPPWGRLWSRPRRATGGRSWSRRGVPPQAGAGGAVPPERAEPEGDSHRANCAASGFGAAEGGASREGAAEGGAGALEGRRLPGVGEDEGTIGVAH
ncbi:hypothetical protein QYE76_003568 [Lolium multiflorum]|uniref:Reverse transcriptase domain-containing protein n=1 Tax=Lolium multiflorum TaxID=4521 RepID=A0AAD8W1D9_LOLMU|nr:hypothetical protein QYE76_003568 [Lolium multiflorum]